MRKIRENIKDLLQELYSVSREFLFVYFLSKLKKIIEKSEKFN